MGIVGLGLVGIGAAALVSDCGHICGAQRTGGGIAVGVGAGMAVAGSYFAFKH